MKIRAKVIALIALLFVALGVSEYLVARRIVLPSFAELEHEDARTAMQRINYALNLRLQGLEVSATDWGDWSDNLVNQKVAARLLERLGYSVEVAADGPAAIAAWQSNRFDLIFMDCQMPLMDGYEATREIRRREAGKHHIPIVALTADAMKEAEQKCRAAGMDDYLSKPIDRTKLEACLASYFLGAISSVNGSI